MKKITKYYLGAETINVFVRWIVLLLFDFFNAKREFANNANSLLYNVLTV
jgi:hypothetical protein